MDRGSQLSKDDEDEEEERRTRQEEAEEEEKEEEKEEKEEATDIKSNNPHLAGGEKRYCIVLVVCVFIDLHRFEYLVGGLEHALSPHIGKNNIN